MYLFLSIIRLKCFLMFSFGHQVTQDKITSEVIIYLAHIYLDTDQMFRIVIDQGQGLAPTTASQRSTTARTSPIWTPSYVPVMLVHWVSPLR